MFKTTTRLSNWRGSLLGVGVAALCAGAAAEAPLEVAACTACHGENGISVSDDIPNLAAQKHTYLVAQLEAFRAGDRKNPLMNAIAAQLEGADIATLADYFSGLEPAAQTQVSATGETLTGARVDFPVDWSSGFQQYATKNRPDKNQRREFFANAAAIESMRDGAPLDDGAFLLVAIYKAKTDADGKPLEGSDGYYEKGDLAAFTAMERQPGWGKQVPAHLRNSNWNYAVFSKDGELNTGVNQASCLACHKPLEDVDYMFMHDDLKAAAGG